ncbi:hypothetical protein [Clostridium magnum]|uniref:Uncharacterized protein n=1 Tax=Clostridium magnum DSM 2767 TaxID=1121326 RepID=A0A162QRS6_9CLOT|nr:hypothetical protein [Clostridium magnum]KZL88877.1 hypothetical protein CLMAG_57810 [Clostridium magnum DSM 2767]SHI51204.1 hypothetical protein SAMN02745944_04423 [Clostridium magnum DSM 2767]
MFYKVQYLIRLFSYIAGLIFIPLEVVGHWGKWNIIKNRFWFSKIVNKFIRVAAIIIALVVEISLIPGTIDYCKDIPAFLTKNYKMTSGSISDSHEEGGRAHYQVIVVNGVSLKGGVYYKDSQKYTKYKFYYLPNTHWIMNYEGY